MDLGVFKEMSVQGKTKGKKTIQDCGSYKLYEMRGEVPMEFVL